MFVPSVHSTLALPSAPVVTLAFDTVPEPLVVANVTSVPAKALLFWSFTITSTGLGNLVFTVAD